MTGPVSIDVIKDGLNQRVDTLVRQLFTAAVRDGNDWSVGSLAGEKGQSLKICCRGRKIGIWKDFSTGESGDLIDLVAKTLCSNDVGEAIRWSRDFLGLGQLSDDERRRRERDAGQARQRQESEAAREQADKLTRIKRLWSETVPILGTPAAEYLLGRGIDLERLGRVPSALRFHPSVWCSEVGRALPAMVSGVVNARADSMVAVHRTYLHIHADGRVTKADVRDAKKSWGAFAGGHIPLHRGQSDLPLRDLRDGEWVAISEGIENGLSGAIIRPAWRFLAGVSLANMGNVHLPENVGGVYIIADNDPDRSGLEAQIDKFKARGLPIIVIYPPEGIKDFNDWLNALLHEHPSDQADLQSRGVA